MAARRLEFSADGSLVHNPNALTVWLRVAGKGEIKEARIKGFHVYLL